jgi:hypothetical protein
MTKAEYKREKKKRRQSNERVGAVFRRGSSGWISIRMEYTRWRWLKLPPPPEAPLSFVLKEPNEKKKNSSTEKIRNGVDALLCVHMTRLNA